MNNHKHIYNIVVNLIDNNTSDEQILHYLERRVDDFNSDMAKHQLNYLRRQRKFKHVE